MTCCPLLAGLTVIEIPIIFVDRRARQSKMERRVLVEALGVEWRLRSDALRDR